MLEIVLFFRLTSCSLFMQFVQTIKNVLIEFCNLIVIQIKDCKTCHTVERGRVNDTQTISIQRQVDDLCVVKIPASSVESILLSKAKLPNNVKPLNAYQNKYKLFISTFSKTIYIFKLNQNLQSQACLFYFFLTQVLTTCLIPRTGCNFDILVDCHLVRDYISSSSQ